MLLVEPLAGAAIAVARVAGIALSPWASPAGPVRRRPAVIPHLVLTALLARVSDVH